RREPDRSGTRGGHRSQAVAHRALRDRDEADIGGGQPSFGAVLAEVDRVYRRLLGGQLPAIEVLEQAAGVVEVPYVAEVGLQLGGKIRLADVHVAVRTHVTVPHRQDRADGQ